LVRELGSFPQGRERFFFVNEIKAGFIEPVGTGDWKLTLVILKG
jgi:hypothetical protein